MLDWFRELGVGNVGWIAAAVSIGTVVASLVALPWLLVHIPRDYLQTDASLDFGRRHPVLRVLRNVLGLVVFLLGVAMLVLPGQGLLTMLAGLLLMEFPGKQRLEKSLLKRPSIFRGVNALRRRVKAPPLEPPPSWKDGRPPGSELQQDAS